MSGMWRTSRWRECRKRKRERVDNGQEGEEAFSFFLFGDNGLFLQSFILNCLLAVEARTAPPRCRTSRAGALFAALPSLAHGYLYR